MQGLQMGHPARHRPVSPGGSHLIDPMRASTGTVPLSSSYDPYDSFAAHQAYSGYRPDAPFMTPYDPRIVPREPRLEAQPVSSTTYRDPGKPTKLRTEYAIRPRQRSSTVTAAETHNSLSRLEIPPSPSVYRTSPVIISGYAHSPSPLTGHEGYIVPSSSKHHQRHRISSTDYASDTGHAMRNRASHGTYRMYELSGKRRYPPTGGLRKGEDIDDYDAYSYTNPREQFEKDSAAKLRYDRGSSRRERPLSLTGIDDPQLMKRDPKAIGFPPSRKRSGKSDHDHELRRFTNDHGHSDVDIAGIRRRSSQRAAIALHQDHDEGYSSYRDDYDDGRRPHRQHKRPDHDMSHRQPYDDRVLKTSGNKLSITQGLGNGLGTAGLASGYSDDLSFDLAPRGDHHRSRELVVRDNGAQEPRSRSRSRRRPSRRRVDSDSDAYTSDDDLEKYRREPSVPPNKGSTDNTRDIHDHSRHRNSHSRHRGVLSPKDLKGSDELKRLEPGPSKDADTPPKGILKPPREKFPEEPNPVREGVAPLKDAHKKGIPPGARWTKIDRRLVNPAALEAAQERFEERSEYVIVLRVLTKEEIQDYAVKTKEIRDARYHEYIRERRRRREGDHRRGHPIDDFSSDDEDEEDDLPLAIEGPSESRSSPRASGSIPQSARGK